MMDETRLAKRSFEELPGSWVHDSADNCLNSHSENGQTVDGDRRQMTTNMWDARVGGMCRVQGWRHVLWTWALLEDAPAHIRLGITRYHLLDRSRDNKQQELTSFNIRNTIANKQIG